MLEISYGCGSPVGRAGLLTGQTMVDLGSGGGIDCFIAAKHVGEKLDWLLADSEEEELEAVTRKIRTKIMQQGRRYLDYSILYRSNFQSRLVEEALREAKIPYRILGGMSFYDREEIRDALAYLKVIHNTNDEVSLHRIINTPRRGIGKTLLIITDETCKHFHCEG